MTITKLALTLLAGIGAGCTTVQPATPVALADLPNCFDSNYDKERGLFTMRNADARAVNQQCLLTIRPGGELASASQLTAGNYRFYLANGGGGGAGGTLEVAAGGARGASGGGGGGGGGAGAQEIQTTAYLTEGSYKLTLGSGGPGGMACMPGKGISGGTGWAGSPSSMVRVATGELIVGTTGADTYARPSRAQNELAAGKLDGHGGSGPGQASGGDGAALATSTTAKSAAEPGDSKRASRVQGTAGMAGAAGTAGAAGLVSAGDKYSGGGGGGGATSVGSGGGGGGESPGQIQNAPKRGTLGGGGGGGEGSRNECDPGARGGHGYIALRKI